MGSGKSSAGKALAKKIEYDFLDTDEIIERSAGKDINTIFKENGEECFRSLEEDTVQWLLSNVQKAIISTGGGMLVHCEGLKDVGTIVYLRVPFATIMSRMNADELAKRPLFQDAKMAEAMYDERDAIYEKKADLIIDADAGIEEVLGRLFTEVS